MDSNILLITILIFGFFSKSRVLLITTLFLLIIQELNIKEFFIFFSSHGIEIGLFFLLAAIISSLLLIELDFQKILDYFLSYQGLIAFIAGILATILNKMGLHLLESDSLLITAIVIGSIFGILFFEGIPVGPLMAAGIAVLLIRLYEFFTMG